MITPIWFWRIAIIAGFVLGAAYVNKLIKDNAQYKRAITELTRAVNNLDARQDRYDQTLVANQTFDTDTGRQASVGVAHNESTRRTNSEVIAIDKPWPAAMRRRVFDNPDPASGSTEAAGAATAGAGGGNEVSVPGRADGRPAFDASRLRQSIDRHRGRIAPRESGSDRRSR